jgi:voltage-gated potassium channel
MIAFRRRFAIALLAFALLSIAGGLGYRMIEGWSLADGLYMAVITITAVGYGEVQPLTQAGRNFTVGLLIAGISWMGLWFALITSFFVELDLRQVMARRRLMKRLEQLSNHIIVGGAGRTGLQVLQELEDMSVPWVAIEADERRIQTLQERFPEGLFVEGDATHDDVLLEAGADRAHGLVACLSADADNLFVCLSARDLKSDLTIIARAYEEETMDKLYRAGATHVVSPNVSGAVRMASMLVRPSVVSFLDITTRSSDLDLRIEQATIPDSSALADRTLAEAEIPARTGLIVMAVRSTNGRQQGHFTFNPSADTRLKAGDELIVLGTQDQIERLRAYVAS